MQVSKSLLRGFSDELQADVELTYAQAVTILMRLLGYTDADAGMLGPRAT